MSNVKLEVYKGKNWVDKDGKERDGTYQLSVGNKKELAKDDACWEAGELVGLGVKETMDIKVIFPAQIREIKYVDKVTMKEKSFETINMVAQWLDIPDHHHAHQNEYGSLSLKFNATPRMKDITTSLEPSMCYTVGVEVSNGQDGKVYKCITFKPLADPTESENESKNEEATQTKKLEDGNDNVDKDLDGIWD